MPTLLIAVDEQSLPEGSVRSVRKLAPDYDVLVSRDAQEIEERAADIEVAAGSFPRALLANMPQLRWFQQWGAGADWLRDHPQVRAKDFVLTNASGVHPVQIGEHVFALLLAFARQLPKALEAQRQRKWLELGNHDVFELQDKTLLLVGVGAIGERTARLAQAFGMRVVGLRRHPARNVPGVDRMVGLDGLHAELPGADAVVLTVPLTRETRHLLGARELALMKDSACLVNIGRGGTVDEAALVKALEAGKFVGVGLDVFEHEPLSDDSPLWTFERVVVTAHYAGASPHYDARAFGIFVDNLGRYLKGEELTNVVDKDLGY